VANQFLIRIGPVLMAEDLQLQVLMSKSYCREYGKPIGTCLVAAAMLLSNHLKMELRCISGNTCLIGCNNNQFIPSLAFPRQEGAYMYYDTNRGIFVRSGKVVRQGFNARHDEHLPVCKEEKASPHFYFMNPLSNGKRKDKRDKIVCFMHLRQVVAARFDPAADPVMHVHKDHKIGRLLILSDDNKHQIKSSLKKNLNIVQNYQEFIAYILEFGYNLALSPVNNLFRSLEFELVLGVFGV
jgi:hypothetical protein